MQVWIGFDFLIWNYILKILRQLILCLPRRDFFYDTCLYLAKPSKDLELIITF